MAAGSIFGPGEIPQLFLERVEAFEDGIVDYNEPDGAVRGSIGDFLLERRVVGPERGFKIWPFKHHRDNFALGINALIVVVILLGRGDTESDVDDRASTEISLRAGSPAARKSLQKTSASAFPLRMDDMDMFGSSGRTERNCKF